MQVRARASVLFNQWVGLQGGARQHGESAATHLQQLAAVLQPPRNFCNRAGVGGRG